MDLDLPSIQQTVQIDEAHPDYEGGGAKLYKAAQCPGSLIRIPKKLTDEWIDKVTAMRSSSLATVSIGGGYADLAWPQGLVYTAGTPRKLVGVELPKIEGRRPLNTLWQSQSVPFRDLLLTARNIAWAADVIHAAGHVIGDFHPGNILVAPNTFVTIIDCDSFHFVTPSRVFHCGCGRPIYLTPELLALKTLAAVDRTPDQDAWAFAVLTFQLLTGNHPMTSHHVGSGTKLSLPKRIEKGLYLYSGKCVPDYEPSPMVPPIDVLHDDLQDLMHRMFIDGHRHPSNRPLVGEWQEVLERCIGNKKYVRMAEVVLSDHRTLLQQLSLQHVVPGMVSPTAATTTATRSRRRWAVRSAIAAGTAAAIGIPAFIAYERSLAVPSPTTDERRGADRWTTSPLPPATYSVEEYGVGRPTPDLWHRLADED